MKQLRLVEVMVQAMFVVDDGETLTKQVTDPVTVPASEWDAFPEAFKAQMAALQEQVQVP